MILEIFTLGMDNMDFKGAAAPKIVLDVAVDVLNITILF